MKFNSVILVAAGAFLSIASVNSTWAGQPRRDFEGTWRNSYGEMIRIVQYGNQSVLVTDESHRQNYGISFDESSELPSTYISFQKDRSFNAANGSVMQGGSYTAALSVAPSGSTATAKVDLELSVAVGIHDLRVSVNFSGKAKVAGPQPLEHACEGVFRPRALVISASGFKVVNPDWQMMNAAANLLINLGTKLGLKQFNYSETLIELDPNPLRTARALAKCGIFDTDAEITKYIPEGEKAEPNSGFRKLPAR